MRARCLITWTAIESADTDNCVSIRSPFRAEPEEQRNEAACSGRTRDLPTCCRTPDSSEGRAVFLSMKKVRMPNGGTRESSDSNGAECGQGLSVPSPWNPDSRDSVWDRIWTGDRTSSDPRTVCTEASHTIWFHA
jgi:hypothetical protein